MTGLSLYANEDGHPEMSMAALVYFFAALIAFCAPGLCRPQPSPR
ncbi:hypothetical protein [Streptomyces sp. LRE541]|nr:hypothetical protein [Streptomyces sp. LRE541]